MTTPKPNESNKKVFWKKSTSKLPGSSLQSSPLPTKESPQHAPKHKLTFKEFEDHTQDAWDATDDDILGAALAKLKLDSSPDQIKAAAQAVIDQHSKTNEPSVNSKTGQVNGMKIQVSESINPSSSSSVSSASDDKGSSIHANFQYVKKVPGGASRTMTKTEEVSALNSVTTNTFSSDGTDKYDPSTHHVVTETSPSKIPSQPFCGDSEKSMKKMVLSPPSIAGGGCAPKAQSIRTPLANTSLEKENSRIEKFHQLMESDSIELGDLRKLSWSGIPGKSRAAIWKLLSGYLPTNKDRRETVLLRKRNEYFNFVKQFYASRDQPQYQSTFHQVFERLLFVWAVRHPASGYVQGINDLVTPFFVVFLAENLDEDCEVETYDVSQLSEDILKDIEADTYWCLSNLLDGIQDNYTFAQPGVQKKVNKLRELTKRVDAELHAHLENEQIEYLQFSFRWMNNLLMRELPLRCTIRLWDTYLAEIDGFSDFHLYVCAAFLKQWRKQLLSEKDFQGLMLMIQNVPTHHWGDEEIKLLLAEAFRLKYTFADAPSHLPSKR